jgi:protein O-mannosyl-transferase
VNLKYALAIVAIGIATFWNSQSGTFLLDDFASIHENTSVRSLWPLTDALSPPNRGESVAGRPLVNLSVALNYAAGGLDVRGYHVFNIAIHIACALLLMGIVRRALETDQARRSLNAGRQSRQIAAACALLWMVHPLQSEAANYIVARTESMMGFFYLLSMYAAVRGWMAASVVSCALGMACKESMVTAPIAIVLLDRAVLFRSFKEALRARRGFYLALAATWVVLAILVSTGPRGSSAGFSLPWHDYLLNQAVIVTRYVRLLVWPTDLVLDYGPPVAMRFVDVWPYIAFLTALGIAALAGWRANPLIGFPLIAFFLTLAPTSLVPIVTEAGAERRMYLPAAFLVSAVVIAAWRLLQGRAAAIAVGVVATLLINLTVTRNREYESTYGMWRTVVDRRPHGRAYLNLATAAQALGRNDEILPLLRRAVQDLPDAEYGLGAQLYLAGSYEEAISHLQAFLRARPTHPQAVDAKATLIRSWTDLGIARAKAGSIGAAADAFRQALAVDPANPDLHRNLANALLDAGDAAEAARHARVALQYRPGDGVAQAILDEAQGRLKSQK